ncbi:hypothetical protein HOLleu_26191 [Holothuria leucospilota]|uniref:Uncharacterized protein n=1 Tax=Holothuria leucospilota TaxID=206669 RepID=A0A9Q1H2C1_HOLLE|nr:hypothetical protein HOLleu_26191 [Holothuria leucospilota]
METEIKDLKTQVDEANKEKDRLLKENKTQQSKVEELSKLVEEKENALIQQRQEAETLISKEQPSSQSFTESQKDRLLSPKQAVKVTPKIAKTPLTGKHVVIIHCVVKPVTPREKTPSHGILKTAGDATSAKKRSRVMFAAEKSESKQDNGSESDSSTSQLMEIEMDNIPYSSVKEKQKKKGIPSQKVTPIRVKPSPRHERESPMDISPLRDHNFQQKPSTKTTSLTKKTQDQLTNNTRKTPKKAFRVKSWGDSPYRKKKKTTAPMKAKQADLSWFENDAVFGFFE